ncbi:CHAT domain-containing protein [Nostoc sp. FACHB-190]|uniref:CHAT domain-containing protein n=1 Tax=Nostoc sp. FACHB-190 TaxID=2692838 RepID=UPI001686E3C0|nr:CHAT domain-containing protein [Nostoc sp. FACHB-190]MBD2299697.1 CHAT domain-containing protein [Nostoc sp. FACHB-190]
MVLRKTNWRYRFSQRLKIVIFFLLGIILFINVSGLLSDLAIATTPAINAEKLEFEGKVLYEAGQFDAAANVWQQAAHIYQKAGNEEGKLRNLINVAEALQANGMDLKACNQILQAFDINQPDCRKLAQERNSSQSNSWLSTLASRKNSLSTANGLKSLGDVLQKLNRPDLSIKVLNISLQVAQNLSSPTLESSALLSLGNAQRTLGERTQIQRGRINQQNSSPLSCEEQAKDEAEILFYQQANSLYQKAAAKSISSQIWTQAQLNYLSLLLKINQLTIAQNLVPQIESQLEELPIEQATVFNHINFAQSLICFNQFSPIKTVDVKDIAQQLIIAWRQAKSLGNQRAESYAIGYLAWLYEQNQQYSEALALTQKALIQAQTISANDMSYQWQWQLGYILREQGNIQEAIAAYNAAIETLKSLRLDLAAINSQLQFSFREKVEPVYRQLVNLLLLNQEASELNANNNLKQARNTIESLQLAEIENFLQEPCLKPRIEIDQIIEKSDTKAAVIYPIILENKLAIILKFPQQQELRYYATSISKENVETTLNNLQKYLPNVTKAFQVKILSQQVYDWLIRPLEADLKSNSIETLVFVLDGNLRSIPMSVLYDKEQQKYLIEKYAIAIAPTLQLFEAKPLRNSSMKVLAAGVSEKRSIAGQEFSPLTNVKKELENIQTKIPQSESLLNNKFTRINIENKLRSSDFSVVHLATHSQFSSNPDQTFILTWDKLLKIEDLVDLLQPSSFNGSNSIELLVLSSCETATGDRQATLGLAGITVKIGAESTLASLWSIDDFSTSEIMNYFYQELKKGTSRAKALQQAQLALLKKENRPYFWSGFVLVGNWL